MLQLASSNFVYYFVCVCFFAVSFFMAKQRLDYNYNILRKPCERIRVIVTLTKCYAHTAQPTHAHPKLCVWVSVHGFSVCFHCRKSWFCVNRQFSFDNGRIACATHAVLLFGNGGVWDLKQEHYCVGSYGFSARLCDVKSVSFRHVFRFIGVGFGSELCDFEPLHLCYFERLFSVLHFELEIFIVLHFYRNGSKCYPCVCSIVHNATLCQQFTGDKIDRNWIGFNFSLSISTLSGSIEFAFMQFNSLANFFFAIQYIVSWFVMTWFIMK